MLELFAEPFSVMVQIVTDIILRKTGFIAQPTRPGQKKKAFTTKSDSFRGGEWKNLRLAETPRS